MLCVAARETSCSPSKRKGSTHAGLGWPRWFLEAPTKGKLAMMAGFLKRASVARGRRVWVTCD